MWRELQLILDQFAAGGGGDPANNAVRFLLALYFWIGLGAVSLHQFRRLSERRDLYIALAAAVGGAREASMFLLEYGAWRGWFPAPFSYRVFPPLEHTLTDLGRVLLGFAYLRYFLPGKNVGRGFLRWGLGVFAGLYLVVAPLWVRYLDTHPELGAEGAHFGLFWGDFAYRAAASLFMGITLVRLARATRGGSDIPKPTYAGFLFLFLDEFLMMINLSLGDAQYRTTFGPIRHNLGIWAIPFFIWGYWEELLRRVREEKTRGEGLLDAVRESEELYRTLVQNIDHGITLVDPQFRVVMANAAHARLLQNPSGSAVGRPCYAAVHGRDSVCPDCPGAVALATGRKASVEKTVSRADGPQLSVRVQAFPVLGPDGAARGFIELVENTTEAKRAEVEHRQLEQRILQAQKMESLGILAGGIAHDFNNLLMGILGNTDLALAKTAPESPVRPYLKSVDQAAQRAADLTNQMLAYSGRGRFVVEPINLSRVVEEIGHLLATVVSKRATLRYRLAPELPPVEADATQVRQVVMNLITNASDALGEREGTITATTGLAEVDGAYLGALLLGEGLSPGRYVFLEVSDTGAGMDTATLARIFDPFFTTKHTGRGLGLAAVLGIVRGHRGALKVYSEPGQGSTFKVLLPALAGGERPAAFPAGSVAAPAPGARGGGMVLVVDDEAMVRETTRAMLEDAGYTVLTANDGQQGVALFRARAAEIAAVVLDMTMPRMGGEEAFREMRLIDERVPVILSSGFNEQEAVYNFAGKGLAGFIQKPYRSGALAEQLRAALAGRQART